MSTPRQIMQWFQELDKYARYDEGKGRRETWPEAVERALTWLDVNTGHRVPRDVIPKLKTVILNKEVLPSMRLMAMAGPAADRSHSHIYNCCFLVMDSLASFHEALLLAMAGVGVAFSVEMQHVSRLPVVQHQSGKCFTHVAEDSAQGWAECLRVGVESWYAGHDVNFDLCNIRPAGAVLRTKGGRASGPGPLQELLKYTRRLILSREGQQLRPIDVYDILCWVGWASVSGGVRHTAMLSLSDFDDTEMRLAKSLAYWNNKQLVANTKRELANNSLAITRHLSHAEWERFLLDGPLGQTGEPNIFNRRTALATMPERRVLTPYHQRTLGLNVCGEIFLRPQQFCNLTMFKIAGGMRGVDFVERAELAAILGVMQAACTHFPYLRSEWTYNARDETLLGVSPTGWMENELSLQPYIMEAMRNVVNITAGVYSDLLHIKRPTATTSVKPSGNSSLLIDSTAGIHTDFYPYYIRRITLQATSPLLPVLREAGIPIEAVKDNPLVFKALFPIKGRGIIRSELNAIQQLEIHLRVKEHFCEHNPSQTVTFKTGEEAQIVAWMHEHQEQVAGVTFLRDDGNVYEQAPIEEISEERYEEMLRSFPSKVDWSTLDESEDYTSFPVGCDGQTCTI